MADEKKVHSIRMDNATYDKYREICTQLGLGQAECFSAIVSAYEMDNAKKILPGQADNIADFRAKADALVKSYLNILELSAGAENRIRIEFQEQLSSKDKIICSLQENLNSLKETAEKTEKECLRKSDEMKYSSQKIISENESLKEKNSGLLEQIESINQVVRSLEVQLETAGLQIDDLTEKNKQLILLKQENVKLSEKAEDLNKIICEKDMTLEKYKGENIRLKNSIEVIKSDMEREKEYAVKEAVMLRIQKQQSEIEEFNKRIEEINRNHSEQIKSYLDIIASLSKNRSDFAAAAEKENDDVKK